MATEADTFDYIVAGAGSAGCVVDTLPLSFEGSARQKP
jgi:hypothetical protein